MDLPGTRHTDKSALQIIDFVTHTLCNSDSIPNSALWHFRLGHASMPLLKKLSNQISYVHANKIGVCDV